MLFYGIKIIYFLEKKKKKKEELLQSQKVLEKFIGAARSLEQWF